MTVRKRKRRELTCTTSFRNDVLVNAMWDVRITKMIFITAHYLSDWPNFTPAKIIMNPYSVAGVIWHMVYTNSVAPD